MSNRTGTHAYTKEIATWHRHFAVKSHHPELDVILSDGGTIYGKNMNIQPNIAGTYDQTY